MAKNNNLEQKWREEISLAILSLIYKYRIARGRQYNTYLLLLCDIAGQIVRLFYTIQSSVEFEKVNLYFELAFICKWEIKMV